MALSREEQIERLRHVMEIIEQYPRRFDMGVYLQDENETPPENHRQLFDHECETAACFAGFAIATYATDEEWRTAWETRIDIMNSAPNANPSFLLGRQLLGLTEEQACALFLTRDWPAEFRSKYWETTTSEEQVEVLKERIEHFILKEL